MEQFIGCDAHKKFSGFASIDERGVYGPTARVGQDREAFRKYLLSLPAGSEIALETSGYYYWIVDAMEEAGHHPRLAHALTAKRRMEGRHKTDARDARGLAMLLRNGTLPEVWISCATSANCCAGGCGCRADQREALLLLQTKLGFPFLGTF